MQMLGDHEDELLHRFYAFHSRFQTRMVPLDLIERACAHKSLWLSSGSLGTLDPVGGIVPHFLTAFWKAFQYHLNTDGTISKAGYVKLVTANGVRYVELDESYYASAKPDESDQELVSQCFHTFIHAFPSRNAEILGEETARRLVPLVTSFIMPLLASITTEDIKAWLLPTDKDRTTDYVTSLCDCLQQISLLLGRGNPFIPLGFLDKMFDALGCDSTSEVEGMKPIVAIIKMTKASITLKLDHLTEIALGIPDERSNAWLGSLFTLMPAKQMPDEFLKVGESWKPLSKSDPSAMEYLVAVKLLPEEQLNHTPVSTSLSPYLSAMQGLLLSKKGLHDAAARVLSHYLSTISPADGISLEAGTVAAECANCYNILRQEQTAKSIATEFLSVRKGQKLHGREDWFFLSLSLIDSLIGVGAYTLAKLRLQDVIAEPSIPTLIYAMSCLRLSKIHRRTCYSLIARASPDDGAYIKPVIKLFPQVPRALQQEILEEVSCWLVAKYELHKEIEDTESLLDTLNRYLGTTTIDTSPAQSRYENIQSSVRQRMLHKKDAQATSSEENTQANSASEQSTFSLGTLLTLAVVSNDNESGTMFVVPSPRQPDFVFRDEVTAIAKILSDKPRAPNICLLYGEAGIGKSSIAKEVAYYCRRKFDVIIWIESGSTIQVDHRLFSIATKLGMYCAPDRKVVYQTARTWMSQWLKRPLMLIGDETRTAEYLVVFDGFWSDEDLQPFWPSDSISCSILVTARKHIFLPSIGYEYLRPHEIKLGRLSSQQAMLVHGYYMGWRHIESRGLSPEFFGGHPLAIKKAGILAKGCPLSAWHVDDDFNQRLESCLHHKQFATQPNHSAPLIRLWFYFCASQKAIDLLSIICYFDDKVMPGALLSSYTLPPDPPSELVIMMKDFELARNELLEFSLIWRGHEVDILITSLNIGDLIRDHIPLKRSKTGYADPLRLIGPCLGIDLYRSDAVDKPGL